MDQAHWLMREQESLAHAHAAIFPDVRSIHNDLARRYSAKAAEAAANGSVSAPAKPKGNLREQLMTAFHRWHRRAG
jgi:hypothetical protein